MAAPRVQSVFARGFSSFGATRECYRAFLRACRRIGLKCTPVVASEFTPRRRIRLRAGCPVVVFQDLLPGSHLLAQLINVLLYPVWFQGIPLCFFSASLRKEYSGAAVRSGSLHTDFRAVTDFLLTEQLIRLLDLSGSRSPVPVPPGAIAASLDDDLDESQSMAVAHSRGPMRLLAPAGSGKTKTLVNRVCNLVNQGIDPGTILPLAFNRKAAAEMNIRLDRKKIGRVHARTFHSLGYEIVRAGSRLVFDPETEPLHMRELLHESLQSLDPAPSLDDRDFFRSSVALISRAKMDMLPRESMTLTLHGKPLPFAPVFARFIELQEKRGFMNFDDMIYFAVKILIDNDGVRREYQERYSHVLVDEFQDLNRAQMLLLDLLALPENNLFVVGDDDQLIYGWRGATVRGIIEFPRIHPCARECVLSTNYRSSSRIIAHAGWLISRNRERVRKSVSPRAGAPPGDFDIELRAGLWEQAQAAAEWITGRNRACPWGESAVLFRYNAHQFAIALALDRLHVPHTAVDRSRLFDSRAGRDIVAWLRVVISPGSVVGTDIERLLRRPVKLIRKSLIERLETWQDVETLAETGLMTAEEEESLEELLCRIRTLRLGAPGSSAYEFIEEIDRTGHLRRFYGRKMEIPSEPDEADDGTYLDVLEAVAREFPTCEGFLAHIDGLRSASPVSVPEPETPPEKDEVVLSTIHRAKGKEFSRVVFFDLSRRRRPGPLEIEEERRVAYVGLTRARDALMVTADGRRQSQFLLEAAHDPRFAGRMREDLESELVGLRKRLRRRDRRGEDGSAEKRIRIVKEIDALEEALRCRAMTSFPAPRAAGTRGLRSPLA